MARQFESFFPNGFVGWGCNSLHPPLEVMYAFRLLKAFTNAFLTTNPTFRLVFPQLRLNDEGVVSSALTPLVPLFHSPHHEPRKIMTFFKVIFLFALVLYCMPNRTRSNNKSHTMGQMEDICKNFPFLPAVKFISIGSDLNAEYCAFTGIFL